MKRTPTFVTLLVIATIVLAGNVLVSNPISVSEAFAEAEMDAFVAELMAAPDKLTRPDARPGVYIIGSPHFPVNEFPVVGNLGFFRWTSLEENGPYSHFSRLDQFLEEMAATGRRAGIALTSYDGPEDVHGGLRSMPNWAIVEKSDPMSPEATVICLENCDAANPLDRHLAPKFWSPAYLEKYRGFVERLAERYAGDPRIEFIAMGTGMYGETRPSSRDHRSVLVNTYNMGSDDWIEAVNRITDIYIAEFGKPGGGFKTPILIQSAPFHQSPRERVAFTTYAASQGVGISLNGLRAQQSGANLCHQFSCTCCGMFDQLEAFHMHVPVAQESYGYMLTNMKHFYWAILNGLNLHLDYLRLRYDSIASGPRDNFTPIPERIELLRWAEPYWGATLETTPSVWVALREYTDPWYFPPETNPETGTWSGGNKGNYEFWLYQIDSIPGGRSVAETNDNRLQRPAYNSSLPPAGGNYAQNYQAWTIRRTDRQTNNPRMFFMIHPGYMKGGINEAEIKVTFWDVGNYRWSLVYDSINGPKRAQIKGSDQDYVQNTNGQTSGHFRTVTFHVTDARFDKQLGNGRADFYIDSQDPLGENQHNNVWVHFVDVKKIRADLPTPTPTFTPTPTATPTPTTGGIAGVAFYDLNGDGQYQVGEPLLAGAVISLHEGGTGGNTIATRTTTSNGQYSFTGLNPGIYGLSVQAPAGYTASPLQAVNLPVSANQTTTFNWAHVQATPTTGTISGRVFEDLNGNGAYDPGEPGVAGVSITLHVNRAGGNGLDPADQPIAATISGVDGMYNFNEVEPGSYVVARQDPVFKYTGTTPNMVGVEIQFGEDKVRNFGLRAHQEVFIPLFQFNQ